MISLLKKSVWISVIIPVFVENKMTTTYLWSNKKSCTTFPPSFLGGQSTLPESFNSPGSNQPVEIFHSKSSLFWPPQNGDRSMDR